MQRFTIDIDEFCEEVFYELERISPGQAGHYYEAEAESKEEAAAKLTEDLKPFILKMLERDA